MNRQRPTSNSDLALLGHCGLYCGACSFRVAHEENDRRHLRAMPGKYEYLKHEELQFCPGCRADDENDTCVIKNCASGRGIEHCGQCDEFPCATITQFAGDGIPHHAEIIKNIESLNQTGAEPWLSDQASRWRCDCGARFSWYVRHCLQCQR